MEKDCKYSSDELTNAWTLLKEMQDNCVEKSTDIYSDPKREEKYKALEIALYSVNKVLWE